MRTTIDLPDPVYRRMKAIAALQGQTIKDFVQRAVERQLGPAPTAKKRGGKLPVIKGAGHVIRPLSGEEMDELLFG